MNIGCGMAVIRATAAMMASALLALALVTPVLGGVPQCSLQAIFGGGSATEVEAGQEVLIEGSGFPPNAEIQIAYSVDAAPLRTETVTADATGFFETSVIPAPGEEGLWTVQASQIKGCSDETTFLVVAPVDCQLQATLDGGSATIVETGEQVLIEGTGFPPDDEMIIIIYEVNGTAIDPPSGGNNEIAFTDSTGSFETTVTPQPGQEGMWTVTASQCVDEIGFQVVAAATPAPTPAAQLPNAATSEPGGSATPILGALFILAAAVWLGRLMLARRVR